jgi:hypothetical protein
MLDLGFKEFELAMRIILAIEIVRIIKKNQLLKTISSTYKPAISLAS